MRLCGFRKLAAHRAEHQSLTRNVREFQAD